MTPHNTRISPDMFKYWQDEAARLRDQRNELRDVAALTRGEIEIALSELALIMRGIPLSQELSRARRLYQRLEAVQARLANPHEEDAQ